MTHPYPKLYGFSTTQRPNNITTLCIYKPKPTITVQLNEEYNLDNYLKKNNISTSKKVTQYNKNYST